MKILLQRLTELSHLVTDIDRDNDSDHAKLLLANTKELNADSGPGSSASSKARVLAFKNKAPLPVDGYQNSLKILYSAQTVKKEVVKTMRHIPSAPARILDAPDMLDDYCKHHVFFFQCSLSSIVFFPF